MVGNQISYKFPQSEKLKSKKQIDNLFGSGRRIHEWPIRVVWDWTKDSKTPIKFGVSVPKKRIKKAVDRNQIKRRIREAYRLNNQALKRILIQENKQIHLMVIFQADAGVEFSLIQEKIILTLQRLQELVTS